MESIVVTGASGSIGRRVVRQLAADRDIHRIVAVDKTAPSVIPAKVETHKIDLLADGSRSELAELLEDASTLVHLVESDDRRDGGALAKKVSSRVIEAATSAKINHIVVLSSALVYGARANNPIPILESQAPDPHQDLLYAVSKLTLEERVSEWIAEGGGERSAVVLRATTTLSEHGAGWVAKALRAATSVRPDQVDPPVQFLHHDDLASAVSFVTARRLSGVFNVAPDGWIGAETFRELAGDPGVRLPANVGKKVLGAARRYGIGSIPSGIEPYVQHPWVVANDKLRDAGWVPAFSNEEAFVLGTPARPWAMSAKRRQEVALGAVSAGMAGAFAVGLAAAKRLSD